MTKFERLVLLLLICIIERMRGSPSQTELRTVKEAWELMDKT